MRSEKSEVAAKAVLGQSRGTRSCPHSRPKSAGTHSCKMKSKRVVCHNDAEKSCKASCKVWKVSKIIEEAKICDGPSPENHPGPVQGWAGEAWTRPTVHHVDR